ncbi:MAG: 16S rRNA (uracil(1498)-N(3))-methyltransferase [Treponema sp.]|nr:16S rRNA (uracil(1498)-N(3))-methyltransferase [Treponema sp.]
MKHFVLRGPPDPDGKLRLTDKDYHYLVRVRRLKAGMSFQALLDGQEKELRVVSTRDKVLVAEVIETHPPGRPSLPALPPIILFQSLPQGTKMDTIVRQAAEGAVNLIVPFASQYSNARLSQGDKHQRWERIIREARQQSGSLTETQIRPAASFEEALSYWRDLQGSYQKPLGLLLHPEAPSLEGPSPLAKGSFHSYLGTSPDLIALAVGPEGGFAPREVQGLEEAGFKPLMMGPTILRTETAALYGTAVIRILLLESNAWIPRPLESCS